MPFSSNDYISSVHLINFQKEVSCERIRNIIKDGVAFLFLISHFSTSLVTAIIGKCILVWKSMNFHECLQYYLQIYDFLKINLKCWPNLFVDYEKIALTNSYIISILGIPCAIYAFIKNEFRYFSLLVRLNRTLINLILIINCGPRMVSSEVFN